MNTKEAIDRLEDFISDFTAEENNNMVEEFDQIIFLLKRGEKYEAMWERCKKHHSYDGYVGKIMNDFEQKYFPGEE